jgi:hypothetical protein
MYLRAHLAFCAPCRHVDVSLKRTLDLLRDLGKEP